MDGNLKTYRNIETASKSQLDLILQVYDGAIKAYRQAANHFEKEESEKGSDQLDRAKRFITHLYTTLNEKEGGEIASNLGKLYAYLINQTDLIQATKDLTVIDDNINILNELRQGWQGLKEKGVEVQPESPIPVSNPGRFTGSA